MATQNTLDLALSGSTGTGNFVGANTPTLITPAIGSATGTRLVLSDATITNLSLKATNANGITYFQCYRNTTTQTALIQFGASSSGGTADGLLINNSLTNGPIYFTTNLASDLLLTLDATLSTFTQKVVAPSFAPNTTSGIIGTTTNDSAAAGSVGEFISSIIVTGSAISLTTATPINVTSISLTAGDWDVWGNVGFKGGNTTLVNYLETWISLTSATVPALQLHNGMSYGAAGIDVFNGNNVGFQAPGLRMSVAGTTTVYLGANAAFTVSTALACGGIYARRVR